MIFLKFEKKCRLQVFMILLVFCCSEEKIISWHWETTKSRTSALILARNLFYHSMDFILEIELCRRADGWINRNYNCLFFFAYKGRFSSCVNVLDTSIGLREQWSRHFPNLITNRCWDPLRDVAKLCGGGAGGGGGGGVIKVFNFVFCLK